MHSNSIFKCFIAAESSHVLYKQNWTLEALDPLRKLEANMIREMASNRQFFVRAWSFTDSLFYSVTILTTIGKFLTLD